MSWCIEYLTYNNYNSTAYADTKEEADRIKSGLEKLPHVTKVDKPFEVK